MSRKSLIKRIFSLGRTEGDGGEAPDEVGFGGSADIEATAGGEAAVKPSITEILFRRKSTEEGAPGAAGEGTRETTAKAMVPDRLSDRHLSRREETAQRMSEGFENLSGLLSSINEKLETGNDRGLMLAESFEELPEVLRSIPETNRAQIEFLTTISKQLDMQTVRSGELIEHFSSLPEILRSIPESQRDQMERLKAIISQLSEDSNRQMEQLQGMHRAQQQGLVGFQNTQNKSLNLFHKAQQHSLSMFKGSQVSQARQMEALLESTQRSLRWTLIACAGIIGAVALGVAGMIYLA